MNNCALEESWPSRDASRFLVRPLLLLLFFSRDYRI